MTTATPTTRPLAWATTFGLLAVVVLAGTLALSSLLGTQPIIEVAPATLGSVASDGDTFCHVCPAEAGRV